MQTLLEGCIGTAKRLTNHAKFIDTAVDVKTKCVNIASNTMKPVNVDLNTFEAAKRQLFLSLKYRLVHQAINKPDPTRGSFKSLNAIGHAFIQDLSACAQVPIISPFGTNAKASAIAPPPKAESLMFGRAEATINAFNAFGGIATGKRVIMLHEKDSKAKDTLQITSIDETAGKVHFRELASGEVSAMEFGPLLKKLRADSCKIIAIKEKDRSFRFVKALSASSVCMHYNRIPDC